MLTEYYQTLKAERNILIVTKKQKNIDEKIKEGVVVKEKDKYK